MRLRILSAIVCLCALSVSTAFADTVMDVPRLQTAPPQFAKMPTTPPKREEPKAAPVSTEKRIAINIASRLLTVYEGNTKIDMYPVGVGTTATPTPVGNYAVQTMEVNPTWIDPSNTNVQIPSGPDNPLGYRWIGFNGTYGIHGTNRPDTVGGEVSNGCVRMHEGDVEKVYDMVHIGTPVSVYYDRIVINSDPDHTVSYYIYPDVYGWQPLSIDAVKKALKRYGVDTFASSSAISKKINLSDGQPTYVAKAYDLYVNGDKLVMRALQKDGIVYLPAVAIASALSLDLQWNSDDGILVSPYGQALGIVKSDVVYISSTNAYALFHLEGGLQPDLTYSLQSVAYESKPTVTITSNEG